MTHLRHAARRAAVTLLLVLLAVPVFAQSQATTAELNGRVVDAQGGVLPGVTVTARNEATGYVRTAVTDEAGRFTLPLLPPGTYAVSMELAGFASSQRQAVLTVGASVTVNQALQLTGIAETVQVSGASPLVETSAFDPHLDRRQCGHREPADQRPPLPGLRHAHAHRAGRHLARPAVVCRSARHQRQRQHRRRRLQPAVLRRPARRRAQQQRLHRAAGRRSGVPGRGRRLLGRVRPVDRRPRQRHHQVGHQPDRRLGVLRQPPPQSGRQECVRADRRPHPAAIRRRDRRTDSARSSVLLRRLRTADLQERARRGLQSDRRPTDCRQRRGLRLLPLAREPTSTPPTTPSRPWARSTTSGRPAAALAFATATAQTRR